jgi:hypothetical protein
MQETGEFSFSMLVEDFAGPLGALATAQVNSASPAGLDGAATGPWHFMTALMPG